MCWQGESLLSYLKSIPMDKVVLPEGDDYGIRRWVVSSCLLSCVAFDEMPFTDGVGAQ
jgi:hypothetical protein